MKLIIEVENKNDLKESKLLIEKIKKISNKDVKIKINNKFEDVVDKIENLSWEMGLKKYSNRDDLYDR